MKNIEFRTVPVTPGLLAIELWLDSVMLHWYPFFLGIGNWTISGKQINAWSWFATLKDAHRIYMATTRGLTIGCGWCGGTGSLQILYPALHNVDDVTVRCGRCSPYKQETFHSGD